MAGQSAPHKRGGTHRVKDEDKTNSKFDDYKYAQLKDECIARKLYVKDMKKSEMARALAKNDLEAKRAEREAAKDRERKHQQLQREKQEEKSRRQRAYAERQRQRRQKEERRKREESVSDDTLDEEELQIMKEMFGDNSDHGDQEPVGRALSEESWASTSTETASCCSNASIPPGCKLRLFEWTYGEMPSPTARPSLATAPESLGYGDRSTTALAMNTFPSSSDDGIDDETAVGSRVLPIPRRVPYAPIKVHTTDSKEKMFLPGHTYPPGIDADYVPLLSERTRRAARNGILEGVLRGATIEPATAWTDRTRVQGWNARMFFTLPLCNEDKSLADVYQKWVLENRRLLRVRFRGNAVRGERGARHAQRHSNKGKKQAEVFEASRYRPTAVCYLPAYLDYFTDVTKLENEMQNEVHDLASLFYIRFPGCDVPHYYFYTRKGEWADPTRPNPEWNPELADDILRHSQFAGKRLPDKPKPIRQFPVRIKRSALLSPPASSAPSANMDEIISHVEYELYSNGLKSTIYKYRTKWRNTGRSDTWEVFSRHLPDLYPSGALPSAPPVQASGNVSVAMKIASIESGHAAEKFTGDEPWTSKDDEWWDVVIVRGQSDEVVHDHEDVEQDLDELDPKDLEALYRRASVHMSFPAVEACEKWLENVEPEYVPLSPDSMSDEREEWEARVFDHGRGFSQVTCPFCMRSLGDLDFQEQAEHMYGHSNLQPIHDQIEHRLLKALDVEDHIDHRVLKAVHVDYSNAYDASVEADNEETSQKLHASPKPGKKRDQISTRRLDIDTHAKSTPSPRNKSPKRKRTTLGFLDTYAETFQTQKHHRAEPDSLHRRPSAPSTPTPKKRRRVVDKTYRAPPSSSDSDATYVPVRPLLPTKKRRRIADPTYRGPGRDTSSDEDESTPRQWTGNAGRAKKRKRAVQATRDGVKSKDMERLKGVDVGIESEAFGMSGQGRDRFVEQVMNANRDKSGDGNVVGGEEDVVREGIGEGMDGNGGRKDEGEGDGVGKSSGCEVM
ncbi:hypothetical protein DE146DRAFT_779859 [Phaeosphaeria sp. MPI-PUGE-AT-0046c]|nr:hypothetical protein DE146DRAFT_779859 [Phaeosphaeria sp. MPI-PUGE-AT-0046c]